MRTALVWGTLVAGSLLSSRAFADGPAWCKVDGQINQGFMDDVKKSDDASRAVPAIAYLMCNPKYVPGADRAALDDAFKRWSQKLDMSEADWADAAQFASGHGDTDIHPIDSKAKWSTLSPIDQYAAIEHPVVETPGLNGDADDDYITDAFGANLSETGRLAYIDKCLRRNNVTPVQMALCQPDLDAFDPKKVNAELHADKTHAPAVKMAIRLMMERNLKLFAARKAEVKKLIAKDAAYGKLFDLAAAERKTWEQRWKDNAELLGVVASMDDAMVSNSRKATEGCHEKTWNALAAAISKVPAKSFTVHRIPDKDYQFFGDTIDVIIAQIIADPNGYLAASAYTQCEQLDPPKGEPDNLAAFFSQSLMRWYGYRGPRTSATSAILRAGIELDDRSAHIEMPDLQRIWFKNRGDASGQDATVESVKVDGAKATINFAKKSQKETFDTGCSQGRAVAIRGDGSIEHELNCTGSKTVMVDHRPSPATVRARYVTGLKPDMVVVAGKDVAWAAFAKHGTSVPSLVLGQPVK
jgi:hypothetical protein